MTTMIPGSMHLRFALMAMAGCLVTTADLPSARGQYSDAWKRCPLLDLVPGGEELKGNERKAAIHELMYDLDSSAAGDATPPLLRPWGAGVRKRLLQSSRTRASEDEVTGPSHIGAAFGRLGLGWRKERGRLRGHWEMEALMSVAGVSRESQDKEIWGNPGLGLRWGRTQTSSDLAVPFHRVLLVGALTYHLPSPFGEDNDAGRELLVRRMPFDHMHFSSGHNASGRLDLRLEALGCHEPFIQFSTSLAYGGRKVVPGSDETDHHGVLQFAVAVGGRPSVASNVMIFAEYAVLRRFESDTGKIAHGFNLGGRWLLGQDRQLNVGLWLSLPAGKRDGFMVTLDAAWLSRDDGVYRPGE